MASRRDLAAAEAAEAPKYAADAWNGAQQAMNEVTAEQEAQQNKFALFRSYTKTKELIAAADQKANEAKDAAVAGKEQAKNDANAALDRRAGLARRGHAADDRPRACRRQPKDFKKDMEAMKGNARRSRGAGRGHRERHRLARTIFGAKVAGRLAQVVRPTDWSPTCRAPRRRFIEQVLIAVRLRLPRPATFPVAGRLFSERWRWRWWRRRGCRLADDVGQPDRPRPGDYASRRGRRPARAAHRLPGGRRVCSTG